MVVRYIFAVCSIFHLELVPTRCHARAGAYFPVEPAKATHCQTADDDDSDNAGWAAVNSRTNDKETKPNELGSGRQLHNV